MTTVAWRTTHRHRLTHGAPSYAQDEPYLTKEGYSHFVATVPNRERCRVGKVWRMGDGGGGVRERERGRGRDKKLVRVCRRLAMARGLDRAGPPRHSPRWQPRHCTPEYKKLHPLIKSYEDVNSMSMFSKNSLRMIQGVLYHMRFWKTRYCTTRLGFSSPRTRSPFLL